MALMYEGNNNAITVGFHGYWVVPTLRNHVSQKYLSRKMLPLAYHASTVPVESAHLAPGHMQKVVDDDRYAPLGVPKPLQDIHDTKKQDTMLQRYTREGGSTARHMIQRNRTPCYNDTRGKRGERGSGVKLVTQEPPPRLCTRAGDLQY